MRRALAASFVVIGLAASAGCGGDSDAQLDGRVDAVRSAIAEDDRAAAERALDELAFAAGVAVEDGSLSSPEGEEIAQLVESSRVLLDEVLPTTTTTTSTTTTTTTTAPPEDDENKKKGKGHKDDDDDD